MDVLLEESPMVVDIPDVDTSKLPEGVKEGATELPCETKEEPMEPIAFGESVFSLNPGVAHKDSPTHQSYFLLGRVLPRILFLFLQWHQPYMYRNGGLTWNPTTRSTRWHMTRVSMLFPPATIEALEILSYSYLSNSLLYVPAEVGSYMVATTRRLRQSTSSFGELALIRLS